MDSDRNSNRFLGFRRRRGSSGEIKKPKSLALMHRSSFQALFVLLLIADVCKASSLSKHRFLIGDPPKVNSDNSTSPPIPIPKPDLDPPLQNNTGSAPPAKTPDPIPDPNNGTKPGPAAPPPASNQTQTPPQEKPTPVPVEKPKPKEKPTPVVPVLKPKENATLVPEKPKEDPNPAPIDVKSPKISKSKGEKDNVPIVMKENCVVAIKACSNADMVACIKSFDSELKEAVVLVQNVGNSTLIGSLSAENTKVLDIPESRYKKIKLIMGESRKIVVKAGNGECVLQMDPPVSEGNFFMRFPSYDKVVTPINGAYLLIITVLIFGGTWAACLIQKRKQRSGGGVPYQELEMALPESVAATEVVTADGWDQGWDDDWDGENAVKSPGAHVVGSISANGLTARSSNKDGWDNNWDD